MSRDKRRNWAAGGAPQPSCSGPSPLPLSTRQLPCLVPQQGQPNLALGYASCVMLRNVDIFAKHTVLHLIGPSAYALPGKVRYIHDVETHMLAVYSVVC